MIAKTIVLLSFVALALADPKPSIISSQTVTTTAHHAAPVVAAAPLVAAAPALAYAAPAAYAAPYYASYASPYYAGYAGYPYAGLAYHSAYTAPIVARAPVVAHAAPVVSAGYTIPSVYGYALNSPLVSPYNNYLLLKKKK